MQEVTSERRCASCSGSITIVEAPLAADPHLPAAVSNAGGLGTLGIGWADDREPWFGKRQPSPIGRLPVT